MRDPLTGRFGESGDPGKQKILKKIGKSIAEQFGVAGPSSKSVLSNQKK
jgi:hypothetical protein